MKPKRATDIKVRILDNDVCQRYTNPTYDVFIFEFSDGQQNVRIEPIPYVDHKPYKSPGIDKIEGANMSIDIRLNTFRDLEVLISINSILKELGAKSVSAYIPYFLGARSDRKFGIGETNYVKNVISPIINAQGFKEVKVFDPHSDVVEACLNNFTKVSNVDFVRKSLTSMYYMHSNRNVILVSPDAGALKKIYDVAEATRHNEVITATKHRDVSSGKITHTEVPDLSNYSDTYSFIIIDDICDGGRTFIELSKVIKKQKPNAKVYLVISHGIFSQGFEILSQHVDHIFTTNSFKDLSNEENSILTQFKII